MRSFHYLRPEEIAAHYVQAKGSIDNLPTTAASLVEDVRSYLSRSGLHHRLDDALDIAIEAHRIAGQIRDQQSAVPNADEVQQGYGEQRPDLLADSELASRVSQLSLREYGAERSRLGMSRSLGDFLGGNG